MPLQGAGIAAPRRHVDSRYIEHSSTAKPYSNTFVQIFGLNGGDSTPPRLVQAVLIIGHTIQRMIRGCEVVWRVLATSSSRTVKHCPAQVTASAIYVWQPLQVTRTIKPALVKGELPRLQLSGWLGTRRAWTCLVYCAMPRLRIRVALESDRTQTHNSRLFCRQLTIEQYSECRQATRYGHVCEPGYT